MTAAPTIMGPPLSPREPRRSGRRSVPATAGSRDSKSSKSTSPGPDAVNGAGSTSTTTTPAPTTTTTTTATGKGGRQKKVKEESEDGSVPATGKKGGKRKKKDVAATAAAAAAALAAEAVPADPNGADEADEGVTRCVCGIEEDEDGFSFWIQCETCKVWQHGQCVGYASEHDAPEHYHCELCRPDLHEHTLPKMAAASTKRRNTMNSRETAYHDEILKQVMDGSLGDREGGSVAASSVHPDEENDEATRRKRKRSATAPADAGTHSNPKHSRSESSTSDRPIASTIATVPDHVPTTALDDEGAPAPIPRTAPKQKRKKDVDGKRHPNQYTYRRNSAKTATAPASTRDKDKDKEKDTSFTSNNDTLQPPPHPQAHAHAHDHSTRRTMQSSRPSHPHGHGYAHAQAQAALQQPLLTSWGLPDYLSHLHSHLPTDTPLPLRVPIPPSPADHQDPNLTLNSLGSTVWEYIEERGVKPKWPGKRMSVADMGKRVRSLMEWVSREQVGAGERERRKGALTAALAVNSKMTAVTDEGRARERVEGMKNGMDVDVVVDDMREKAMEAGIDANPPNALKVEPVENGMATDEQLAADPIEPRKEETSAQLPNNQEKSRATTPNTISAIPVLTRTPVPEIDDPGVNKGEGSSRSIPQTPLQSFVSTLARDDPISTSASTAVPAAASPKIDRTSLPVAETPAPSFSTTATPNVRGTTGKSRGRGRGGARKATPSSSHAQKSMAGRMGTPTPASGQGTGAASTLLHNNVHALATVSLPPGAGDKTTNQLMEELMTDLISFQEKYASGKAGLKELLSF